MTRTCTECGAEFDARSSRAMRCSDACRKRASRAKTKRSAPPAPSTDEARSIVDAALAHLRNGGLEATVAGQAALILARRLAAEVQLDTGSNLIAMIDKLLTLIESLGSALEVPGAPPQPGSPLDDLAKRREHRAAV